MEIKGTKDGILVRLDDRAWGEALDDLVHQIEDKQDFFTGARLILDVGKNTLRAKEIGELQKTLSGRGIALSGVLSSSLVTQATSQKLGLITSVESPARGKRSQLKPLDTLLTGDDAVFLHRTMRSGFKVAYQGHVVILGDVNPGAEIIASGSVLVWGRLRGTVHAGAEGDEAAVVCALDLSPTQLRIATRAATTPKNKGKPMPEIARINEDRIVAEPWQGHRGDL